MASLLKLETPSQIAQHAYFIGFNQPREMCEFEMAEGIKTRELIVFNKQCACYSTSLMGEQDIDANIAAATVEFQRLFENYGPMVQEGPRLYDEDIQLRRQHNALQPISNPPTELLMTVFTTCAPVEGENYYKRIHVLAQVCTAWADIIKHSPHFWTVLQDRMEPMSCHTVFARSADLPLRVNTVALAPPSHVSMVTLQMSGVGVTPMS